MILDTVSIKGSKTKQKAPGRGRQVPMLDISDRFPCHLVTELVEENTLEIVGRTISMGGFVHSLSGTSSSDTKRSVVFVVDMIVLLL